MPNLNTCHIMGNLTRDVELKHTPKGTVVANLGVAINRTWKTEAGEKREDTTFVEVELWGRTAETAERFLRKGSPVYISGRLAQESWDDKSTGQKRSKLKVVGENMQLLGGKDRQGGSEEAYQ